MKNIRWGIIGCGDVTEVKSGPALSKLDGSVLQMVMRRDEGKLVDYSQRHNVPEYSTDYMDLLTNPNIDAIYIATPPHMHCYYTCEAAKYKKIIYVEKPMATTALDCRLMIKACRDEGVSLYTAYYRRGQDKFKTIKEILSSGKIGNVLSFSYLYSCNTPIFREDRNWLMDSSLAGDGLLYDIGSHMMDMALFLLGDVKSAYGVSANQSGKFDVNDVTSGIIEFSSGVQGSVQLSFNAAKVRDEFVIMGDGGSVEFSVMSNDPVVLNIDGKERVIKFDMLQHVQMPFIKDILADIRGAKIMDNEGLYGLRTQEVLEAFSTGKPLNY